LRQPGKYLGGHGVELLLREGGGRRRQRDNECGQVDAHFGFSSLKGFHVRRLDFMLAAVVAPSGALVAINWKAQGLFFERCNAFDYWVSTIVPRLIVRSRTSSTVGTLCRPIDSAATSI
jgi:hypothetical protein